MNEQSGNITRTGAGREASRGQYWYTGNMALSGQQKRKRRRERIKCMLQSKNEAERAEGQAAKDLMRKGHCRRKLNKKLRRAPATAKQGVEEKAAGISHAAASASPPPLKREKQVAPTPAATSAAAASTGGTWKGEVCIVFTV